MGKVTITPEESAMLIGSGREDGTASEGAAVEESAIEKLQKENAALKRQLERQRSDLLILTKAAMHGVRIAWSNLKLIEEWFEHGDEAQELIHGMLAFNEEADQLPNDSTDNRAVPLK